MGTHENRSAGPREIRVFIASPGDLAIERRAFRDTVEELNQGFADGAGVRFVPLGWEDTLAATGRRAQEVINREIDSCDVFVLALHRRWGQAAPDAKPYSSYTEEEFHRALDRFRKTKSPEIFVFFKNIDPGQMADAGPQLAKVLEFRRSLEETRQVLWRPFEGPEQFQAELDRHLRAYCKGELPAADASPTPIVLPLEYVEAVKKAESEAKRSAEQYEAARQEAEARAARQSELELTLARQAATAAREGRLEDARQSFAQAVEGTTSCDVLSLGSEFYVRTGELAIAEDLLRRALAISGVDAETANTAAALGNLGIIYKTRGDLDRAEEMYGKALAISEKLGRQEGIANQYGNLGLIYQTRGDLDRAEEMHRKSLAIDAKLGRQEDIAITYGNLGFIHVVRGELERAEEMVRKALAIDEKLGGNEGIANQCANLGLVCKARGQIQEARQLWSKARDIYARVGMPHMVKRVQGLLDALPSEPGEGHAETGGSG